MSVQEDLESDLKYALDGRSLGYEYRECDWCKRHIVAGQKIGAVVQRPENEQSWTVNAVNCDQCRSREFGVEFEHMQEVIVYAVTDNQLRVEGVSVRVRKHSPLGEKTQGYSDWQWLFKPSRDKAPHSDTNHMQPTQTAAGNARQTPDKHGIIGTLIGRLDDLHEGATDAQVQFALSQAQQALINLDETDVIGEVRARMLGDIDEFLATAEQKDRDDARVRDIRTLRQLVVGLNGGDQP